MSEPPPPPPPTSLPSVLSRRWDESFLSRRRDESSVGCGRLGADDAGGSSSSSRALDRGSQLSSSSRVVCSVCCCSIPVTKAGLLRVHGPLGNRCAGSGMSTFSPAGATASAGPLFRTVRLPVMRTSASMTNLSVTAIVVAPGLRLYIPSSVLRR